MMTQKITDPTMLWLADALDPTAAQRQFQNIFPDLQQVKQAQLVRHKVGRRALIAYDLETSAGELKVLGKIRAKGTDHKSYLCQWALWENAFGDRLGNHCSVPEPLGVVEPWRMWLQRHVPGEAVTDILPTAQGLPLMTQIAALSYKIHTHPVPTPRHHTITDELKILGDRLTDFGQQQPRWRGAITDFLHQSQRLEKILTQLALPSTTIHRDYYADQILVAGDRLWLVDLDLYCRGNPALDVGNFIAHITEQSLRTWGDRQALADREQALKTAYLQYYSGREAQALGEAIEIYTTLTLLRHITISWQIPERRPHIPLLVELCGDRLQTLP
jgi:hypothetical protein